MQRTFTRILFGLFFIAASGAVLPSRAASSVDTKTSESSANVNLSVDGLQSLDEDQKARVRRLVDSIGIHLTSIEGKPWPRRKQAYLALGFDSTQSENDPPFELLAFDLTGPKIRLLASSDGPITLPKGDALEGFDFAAYQISPNEYAFGLRYSRHRSYAAGEASLHGVLMYRIQDSGFQEILNLPTSYEADLAGEWNEDGTRDRSGSSGGAVIIVTKKKTDGFFNWIVKADDGKSARLVWDGSAYAMQGEDPFPTHEFEIFDSE